MKHNVLARFAKIKAFVFDIDGVFTNGALYIIQEGEIIRTLNIHDGYALQLALKKDYKIAIISGGGAMNLHDRLVALGLKDIYMRCTDKLSQLKEWVAQNELTLEDCLYMGDDMPDIPCLEVVGLSTCPKDACTDVLAMAQYISPFDGGTGCVRDVLEKAMKLQNNWKHITHL